MTRGWGGNAVLVAAVVACASLTACGGDDEPSAAPTQGAAESSASSGADTSPSSDPAEPAAYLPVPAGVQLTPQGSDLALRDPAVVAWEPRQDQVGVLDVVVDRVELTSFAESFTGWQLDATTRTSTPYFVRATIENVGDSSLGGRTVPLYAVGEADTLIQASSFQTRFDPCPGNGVFPEGFRPGVSAELCLVYLVPRGAELTAVSFRPTQDFDPITWTGPVKKPEQRRKS